ncbi:MAG: tetratricopeptide repeat protein [Bradymonadia bacterium]
MKSLALTFALMAGAVTVVPAVTVSTADACAMRKVRKPVSSKAMVAKAERAEKRENTRQAIRLYERAMNNSRGDEVVRANAALAAARLHSSLGHDDQALARVKRATELAPDQADAWAAYSALQAKAGQIEGARTALDTARKLGADAETLSAAEAVVDGASAVKTAKVDG